MTDSQHLELNFNLTANSDILNQNVNQDIVESLDKFTQSSITSKELKEKTIETIFLSFVNKLTAGLQNGDYSSLSDLIFHKSILIVEQTGKSEWPLIENLKVTNFDPLSIHIYNYLRYKHLLKQKQNVNAKEILTKAFENLYLLIMKFVEKMNTPFSDEVLWAYFNDLFELYVRNRENGEDLSDIEENIDNLKLEVEEVSSIFKKFYLDINGVLNQEKIEPSNHKEYIIGVLFLLFELRVECVKSGKTVESLAVSRFKNLLKRANSNYLRSSAPIVHFEIEILLNINLFLQNQVKTSVSNLVESLKHLRLFRKFKKSVFILEFFNLFENLIRQLIAVFLSCSGVKINEFVRQFLGISNEHVESLSVRETRGLESGLTLPVLSYLKNNALLNALNSQIEKLRNSPVDSKLNESVLGLFYSNILTVNHSENEDLFALKNSLNKKFNEIYSILNK